ncbi:SgcJ/EcaC family oxidoreductase, partial [Acidobacteria bacterium AH-259-D05]|nr:SgcJ/EcaC family oxidoreductase [Acidobacteria bacterium AH-259-D05]
MRYHLTLFLLFSFIVTIASCAPAVEEPVEEPDTTEADVEAISRVLGDYENALNTGDLDSVMALYADDAVFMPENAPVQVGEQEIRAFYQTNIFEQITLDLTFTAAETEVLGEWAFARTEITGTVTA